MTPTTLLSLSTLADLAQVLAFLGALLAGLCRLYRSPGCVSWCASHAPTWVPRLWALSHLCLALAVLGALVVLTAPR